MTDEGTPDTEREEIARAILGDPKYAPLVTGETPSEMLATATNAARLFREDRASQVRQLPVDFNGGPRETLPGPGPTHEQWLADLFNRHDQ